MSPCRVLSFFINFLFLFSQYLETFILPSIAVSVHNLIKKIKLVFKENKDFIWFVSHLSRIICQKDVPVTKYCKLNILTIFKNNWELLLLLLLLKIIIVKSSIYFKLEILKSKYAQLSLESWINFKHPIYRMLVMKAIFNSSWSLLLQYLNFKRGPLTGSSFHTAHLDLKCK